MCLKNLPEHFHSGTGTPAHGGCGRLHGWDGQGPRFDAPFALLLWLAYEPNRGGDRLEWADRSVRLSGTQVIAHYVETGLD